MKADLAELDRLRATSSSARKPGRFGNREKQLTIEDYVEEMTGERTALRAKNHQRGRLEDTANSAAVP
ncbi:hypothetical protein [Bradyrhizobium sp. CCGB01]|uniref:hypothetical protein n=1 Tax=Bradyrhizobium sp. CCGB01 TaxID=2949634 RepID=UPI0020B31BA3|nr:hypothetical protein [Bradyrhizobium sp. CCGB01]MCP3406437.1 hypothetical protein [Bradyrhizobium sp. CCGB01]